MKCSVCGSNRIVPSHRRGLERLVRYVLPLAPYRCTECWSRLWRFERPIRIALSKTAALLAMLSLIALAGFALGQFFPADHPGGDAASERQEVDSRPIAPPPTVPPGLDGAEATAASTPSAEGPRVLRTRAHADSAAGEFVLEVEAAGPVSDPTVFLLSEPPRHAVDIPGKWEIQGDSQASVSGDLVREVRVGIHADFARLALDLVNEVQVGYELTSTPGGFRLRVFLPQVRGP